MDCPPQPAAPATPRRSLAAALLLAALACSEAGPPPPPPDAIPAGERIGSAALTGQVTFAGQPPERQEINMSADAVCAAKGRGKVREDVVVGPDGGLQNVFIHVVAGLGDRVFAAPGTPAVLDQNGCTYTPRVLGIQAHQLLEIVNSDATMHNVHSVPAANKPFNVGMATQGQRIRKFFSTPEVMVRVKCDLHNWMVAWVGVVEHPFFAVSGPDGRWSIEGLPAGAYTMEARHEVFGTKRVEITVADGDQATVDFHFER